MADIKKTLNDLRADIVAKIDEYNKALKENDFATMTTIDADLKEVEAAYAEAKSVEVFTELKAKENPVREAITTHSYLVIGHKPVREDGKIIGYEIVEDKVRQIDLVKFCKFCGLPVMWQYKVEKFNQLLAMRTADELGLTKAQIKKICDSFYMNDLARQVEMGGTPDSNTAICKQLQKVFDDVLFEDNGKGSNVYKVNSRDVKYLLSCYTKRGKKMLSVAVAKNAYMHRLVMDVMHRVVTGKVYDLEYRMVKEAAPAAKKPAEKKVEAKTEKAETVVVKKSA